MSVFISSCSNNGAGYEYMPNMYRSPSLETYGKNNFFSDRLLIYGDNSNKYFTYKA